MTIGSISNANPSREVSDFLFFSGHGGVYSNQTSTSFYFLGAGAGYGVFDNTKWNFGANKLSGTRWVWFDACLALNPGSLPTIPADFMSAFKGVQFIIGYSSLCSEFTPDNSADYFDYFWSRITANSGTWQNVYFDTTDKKYYQYSGGRGIDPAIVSAKKSSGVPYCDLTFTESTNEQAATQNLVYRHLVFGTPTYF